MAGTPRAGPHAAALDIRHLVVADRLGHPSAANGVHNVARVMVGEQLGCGDTASLTVLAPEGAGADFSGGDSAFRARVLPVAGPSVRGRPIRLGAGTLEALLAGAGPETVFHVHGGREPLLIGLGRALQRRGLPYAMTVHGRFSHVFDEAGRALRRRTFLYLRLLERPLLEGARFVQALSEEEAAVLSRIAPRARIEVVGNGAYSSRLGRAPPAPAPRAPSACFPHFVYCGRYEIEHKGLDLLLEGFAGYRRRGGGGRLTMIGTGPVRWRLVRMAEALDVADAVSVHGPMYGAERDAALLGCDFFVMASRYEGAPLAAMEAARLGLPLIVTAGTGLRAAVAAWGAGIPIARATADAVAGALHEAERAPPAEWQARRAAAWEMVRATGDWSAIATRLRALYRAAPAAAPQASRVVPAPSRAVPTAEARR